MPRYRLAAALLFLCLLLPAQGAPKEEAKPRLKRYESLLATASVPSRIDAIRELKQADDPKIAEILLNKAFVDDFRVAEAAVRFLARTATPAVIAWIEEQGQKKPDARIRFYTLRLESALQEPAEGETREPRPMPLAVLAPFVQDPHWILRLEAATALGKCADEGAVPLLRTLMADKTEPVRCVAILGLADHGASAALPEIRAALLDKDWRVRSAALEAVVRMKDLEAAPILRKIMEKETEIRMIDDLGQALDDLGQAREEAREEAARENAPKNGENSIPGSGMEEVFTRSATNFAGIDYGRKLKELKSLQGRIVFILDCSQSMAEQIVVPPPAAQPPQGPGEGRKEYRVESSGETPRRERPDDEQAMGYDRNAPGRKTNGQFPPTKLGLCQKELCKALRQLKPEISFNIICYQSAGKQKAWKQVLTQASPGAVEEAVAFVKRQAPAGETATYDAVVTALGFQEQDLFREGAVWDWKAWPDTVMLLSDGQPTEGLITQDQEVVLSIRRLYRVCRTRIHTIGVGRERLAVLEDLARATGGRFVQIADIE